MTSSKSSQSSKSTSHSRSSSSTSNTSSNSFSKPALTSRSSSNAVPRPSLHNSHHSSSGHSGTGHSGTGYSHSGYSYSGHGSGSSGHGPGSHSSQSQSHSHSGSGSGSGLRHTKSMSHLIHNNKPVQHSSSLNPNKPLKRHPSKYKEDLLKNECTCKGCQYDKSKKHSPRPGHSKPRANHPYAHQPQNRSDNSVDSVDNFANNILDFVCNKREVKWNI